MEVTEGKSLSGVQEETSLSILCSARAPTSLPPTFTSKEDLVGEFEIYGLLLPGLVVRFIKLYEMMGWLYEGTFSREKMEITG